MQEYHKWFKFTCKYVIGRAAARRREGLKDNEQWDITRQAVVDMLGRQNCPDNIIYSIVEALKFED